MDEDSVESLVHALKYLAHAVTPCAAAGHDETGGHVESLTEAVMGMTAGLVKIADAISDLADAVRGHGGNEGA